MQSRADAEGRPRRRRGGGLAGASIVGGTVGRRRRAPAPPPASQLDPDAERYPASMIKTPIAACLADAWAVGRTPRASGPPSRPQT